MGTVLECQGERNFQNLEQCHEIQGEITTKIVYPINHPCFIGGISLKTNRNFETEEKMGSGFLIRFFKGQESFFCLMMSLCQ